MIYISQTGIESLECSPGLIHINKLLCKNDSFWKNVYHWAETGGESDAHLPSASGGQALHSSLQQKKENGKGVCEKHKERGDKLYRRQLSWQQRKVSRQRVSLSGPTQDISWGEAKPIRVADYTAWKE